MGLEYFLTTYEAKLLLIGVFLLGVVLALVFVGLVIFEKKLLEDIVEDYKRRGRTMGQENK